jgi:hypothetical protein
LREALRSRSNFSLLLIVLYPELDIVHFGMYWLVFLFLAMNFAFGICFLAKLTILEVGVSWIGRGLAIALELGEQLYAILLYVVIILTFLNT